MRFTDGVQIRLSGALRILEEEDGLYIAGRGMLVPVSSTKEAEEVLEALLSNNVTKKRRARKFVIDEDEAFQPRKRR